MAVQEQSSDHTASYCVGGFPVNVGVDSPELLAETNSLLGSFRVESLQTPPWRLVVRRGVLDHDDVPVDLRPIWSGEIAPQVQAVNHVGPSWRRLELLDRGRLDLDLQAHEATMTLAPQTEAGWAGYFLLPLVCEGLIRAGQHPLHAASLVASGDPSRSVLIVAKSGTGKSTTALGLTNGGWKLMGDDLAFLCERDGRALAWGFPRKVHVRRPTLRLLPWLNELPLAPQARDDAFDLPLAALGQRAWESHGTPLTPALLIMLERPNSVGHRCRRLSRAAAIAALAHENVQPIEGATDVHAHAAFGRFATLVQQTPAYSLSVGPRLDGLVDFLGEETGVGS